MEVSVIRKELEESLKTADARLLKLLKVIVESYKDNAPVAYDLAGEPLTQNDYKKEIKAAEKEVSEGNIVTQEALEKEAKDW